MKSFNLQPPPNVLMALTYTSMKPIDALCELVDNAIDSFDDVRDTYDIHPLVDIRLPTHNELNRGEGMIRVQDNGPGMTEEQSEHALTAGYSSRNSYDRLGLFGLGLNIATGKFSRVTRLITAIKDNNFAIEVKVDLDELVRQGSYEVQPCEIDKAEYFPDGCGTVIELSEWWPEGNPNSNFPNQLIRNLKSLREQMGRRYATLLRSDASRKFTMRLRGEECEPFEHCFWSEKRHVTRAGQQIPARIKFNKVLETQQRCEDCAILVEGSQCPKDPSHVIRTIEERIRGWVGVQRYDDSSHYGIDLIRRGRAIRVLEKEAFFKFTDELGKEINDYPIDGPYGRIVGEVHMDHVPVDFTKQNFDRSSIEWERAMAFLRGKSSLQRRQPGADSNDSPVMKIYGGYRRVRKAGLSDMYMGYVNDDGKPQRISRAIEQDFLERFKRKESGYYDDAKWWEKVEEASRKIDIPEECPECDFQIPQDAEICDHCGHILKAKKCVDCEENIPRSAKQCSHCGKPQVPEGPWTCDLCQSSNPPDAEICKCGAEKGTQNPFSLETLRVNSERSESLSISELHVEQADGTLSQQFNLLTSTADLQNGELHLPMVSFGSATPRMQEIFIDKSHPVFRMMQVHPEHMVALECASRLYTEGMEMGRMPGHTVANLQFKILQKYWGDVLLDDPEEVRRSIYSLLDDIREKMPSVLEGLAEDVFKDLSDSEIQEMIADIRTADADIAQIASEEQRADGGFMRHIPPEAIVSVFKQYPDRFFDGKIWNAPWDFPGIPSQGAELARREVVENYLNCLEDCVGFLRYRKPRSLALRRARLSHEFLLQDLVA